MAVVVVGASVVVAVVLKYFWVELALEVELLFVGCELGK